MSTQSRQPAALAPSPVEKLNTVIRDGIASRKTHPCDVRLQRVLDRTYLRPAGSRQRAAELMNLSISAYRHHLRRRLDRVVDWLWQRELYGWPGQWGHGHAHHRDFRGRLDLRAAA